jgi:LuxR family maltose regulon positive regulatory protein
MLLPANLSLLSPLTRREIETLQLIANGATSRQIADDQNITTGTIKNCVWRATVELGADSRTQAVAAALRLGIIK